MEFRYSPGKNVQLLVSRGISFGEIIEEINAGNVVMAEEHHNKTKYPNQRVMHVLCLGQVYLVPYVIEPDGAVFLKTIYPSRKATKQYLNTVDSQCKTPSSVLEKLV